MKRHLKYALLALSAVILSIGGFILDTGYQTATGPAAPLFSPEKRFLQMRNTYTKYECHDIRDEQYRIDGRYILVAIAGRCPDASYDYILFDRTPERRLCSVADNFAGAVWECKSDKYHALLGEILVFFNKAYGTNTPLNLPNHTVERIYPAESIDTPAPTV